MALIVDQQQTNLKHFCRICKKGFGCGRALGGHMRAHGIGDDSGGHIDDEDAATDWEDKLDADAGNVPPANKRMYALRTNPNRLRSSCRACENCGKEFLSWKSFLEHGKCGSEDVESLVSSPADSSDDRRGCGNNWSKRKRSFRAKVGNLIMSSTNNNNNSHTCPSSEEEDLANCLMMLSNAAVDPTLAAEAAEPEESCASASKDEEAQQRRTTMNFIAPISFRVPENNNNNSYTNMNMINNNNKAKGVANTNSKGLFECKACKKVFNSHQALGGHRASHKKVKGCFAARLDHRGSNLIDESLADDDDVITHEEFLPTKSNAALTSTLDRHYQGSNNTTLSPSSKRKSKVHECSICHRIFSSGQALGGHKRCHWITSNAPDTSALVKFQQFHESINEQMRISNNNNTISINNQSMKQQHHEDQGDLDLKLDLNLPAPVMDVKTALFSAEIYLQPWIGSSSSSAKDQENNHQRHINNIIQDLNHHHHQNVNVDNVLHNQDHNKNDVNIHHHNHDHHDNHDQVGVVEDEADSKVKLAKLSELKDMNMSEGSSAWLQVGIGSTTDVGAGP